MIKRTIFGMILGIILVPWSLVAAPFDGSTPLLCTLLEVKECQLAHACTSHPIGGAVMPLFLRIDFEQKKIVPPAESGRKEVTTISHVTSADGNLIVLGDENGHGWSLVIPQDTGQLSLSVSGDHYGFLAFGACTPL